MSALEKVREMLPDPKRIAAVMAFMGCVNLLSAKTLVGKVVEVDRDDTYLLTKEGQYKITSPSLVRAVTISHNKRGGDLVAKINFDETNSTVSGGTVFHSPVRLTDGVGTLVYDVRNIQTDVTGIINSATDLNIGRTINQVAEMATQVAPEPVKGGGIVRCKAKGPNGRVGWAQYHTVDQATHTLMPQYVKGGNTSAGNGGYSQSSNSGGAQYSSSNSTVRYSRYGTSTR